MLCGCGSSKDAVEHKNTSQRGSNKNEQGIGNGSLRDARPGGPSPDTSTHGGGTREPAGTLEPGTLEATPEERGSYIAPPLKPLSAKAAVREH